jgi:lysine biosynthesis protein LysW
MTTETRKSIIAICPGCRNEIFFYRAPRLGEFVTCPECGDLVEVVNLSPLTLDWSPDIDDDDDWQDNWDDYDDDFDYSDDPMEGYDD